MLNPMPRRVSTDLGQKSKPGGVENSRGSPPQPAARVALLLYGSLFRLSLCGCGSFRGGRSRGSSLPRCSTLGRNRSGGTWRDGAGCQSLQLRDVLGLEFFDARDFEQLHGAHDLVGENLDGAVDALASTGHEAVEVGTANERELGPERHRRYDIRTVHDAGVDHHLDVVADLASDLGQQVEGDGGAVELAATVVREQDAVNTKVGKALRVFKVLHSLDHDLAWPHVADDLEVVVVD